MELCEGKKGDGDRETLILKMNFIFLRIFMVYQFTTIEKDSSHAGNAFEAKNCLDKKVYFKSGILS